MRSPGRDPRKLAFYGVLLAFALVLSYVESLIPFFFGVPGMKLGLPNLVVVLLLFAGNSKGGARSGALINLLRIVLAGFLFGSMFGILFSLAGAFVSFAGMLLIKSTGKFSILGVSVAGGVLHNIGQLLVAAFIVKTAGILYDAPFLVIAGALTGALNGIIAGGVQAQISGFIDREEKNS